MPPSIHLIPSFTHDLSKTSSCLQLQERSLPVAIGGGSSGFPSLCSSVSHAHACALPGVAVPDGTGGGPSSTKDALDRCCPA
eukprot:77197-Hanusia_phi.AAC.1